LPGVDRSGTVCSVSVQAGARPGGPKRENLGVNDDVTDPPDRPPYVEAPRFLASLDALDRGLDPPADATPPAREAAAPIPFPREPVERRAETEVRHRPLLDLFPLAALQQERPRVPPIGTAIAPTLSRPMVPRTRAVDPLPRAAPTARDIFYGLTEAPFDLSTDPRFFFRGEGHERAATALLTAIRQRAGLCVLTGETGSGKTTTCRAIAASLDHRAVPSVVLDPLVGSDALVRTLLGDFGVIARDDLARAPLTPRADLDAALLRFLDSLGPLQACAVVVVDEAHRQAPEAIEHLRALAAEGGRAAGVLQVILSGPPDFLASLRTPPLQMVDAAAAHRVELTPLADHEIGAYIRHRLHTAGAHPRVAFDDDALPRIFELSRGMPAVVNLVCNRALDGGFARGATTIDVGLVDDAARALGIGGPRDGRRGALRTIVTALALVALLLAGAAAAAWLLRDPLSRLLHRRDAVPAVQVPVGPAALPDNSPAPPPV